MKVYIVKAQQGEYEEYIEPIIGVFSSKNKALALKAKRHEKIEENNVVKAKCESCPFYKEIIKKKFRIALPDCWTPNVNSLLNDSGCCLGDFIDDEYMQEYKIEEYELDEQVK